MQSRTNNFNYLIKTRKLETKEILINKKIYKDFVIYFTRYDHGKTIKMLSLYYHKLVGKMEEYERKKYSMLGDNILNKVLDKIKKITRIGKFDDTTILIDTDDKFFDDNTLKNVVVLITCIIKYDGKFYPQIFLEEALVA